MVTLDTMPLEVDLLGDTTALAEELMVHWQPSAVPPPSALLNIDAEVHSVPSIHETCRYIIAQYWVDALLDHMAAAWPEVVGSRMSNIALQWDARRAAAHRPQLGQTAPRLMGLYAHCLATLSQPTPLEAVVRDALKHHCLPAIHYVSSEGIAGYYLRYSATLADTKTATEMMSLILHVMDWSSRYAQSLRRDLADAQPHQGEI